MWVIRNTTWIKEIFTEKKNTQEYDGVSLADLLNWWVYRSVRRPRPRHRAVCPVEQLSVVAPAEALAPAPGSPISRVWSSSAPRPSAPPCPVHLGGTTWWPHKQRWDMMHAFLLYAVVSTVVPLSCWIQSPGWSSLRSGAGFLKGKVGLSEKHDSFSNFQGGIHSSSANSDRLGKV